MFTGIVQSAIKIDQIEKKTGLWTLTLTLPDSLIPGLTLGASVALNGTCLTVTSISGNQVTFDVMMASLALTNLQHLSQGSLVNVERAAKFGDDIGGHQLSGHVHDMVNVVEVERPENNCIVWFELKPEHQAYIFDKGYIGLNGCSLTIAQVKEDRFCVYLIPETLSVTTYQNVKVGDAINLEIDSHTQAVVDTVERFLKQKNRA